MSYHGCWHVDHCYSYWLNMLEEELYLLTFIGEFELIIHQMRYLRICKAKSSFYLTWNCNLFFNSKNLTWQSIKNTVTGIKYRQKNPYRTSKMTKLELLQVRFDWVCSLKFDWRLHFTVHAPSTGLSKNQHLPWNGRAISRCAHKSRLIA
jgi:hypothetical protein